MTTPGVATYLDFDEFDRNAELDEAMLDGLKPEIHPRQDWAIDLEPRGPITNDDAVRFLLVHHTATTNNYGQNEVVDQIRDFYQLHVGADRGWVDVAYNFLIDRFGGIWEARAGSLERAVQGDATGGSQGFAQLCSLIGNHHEVAVTVESQKALVELLAWLAHRHRIDTSAGVSADFVSRGSNLWPQGVTVSARTISGHRDMSDTVCPGDFAYGLLNQSIPDAVAARRQEVFDAVAPAFLPTPASEPAAAPSEQNADPELVDDEQAVIRSEAAETASPLDPQTVESFDPEQLVLPLGVTLVAGGLAGLIALRRRRVR